MHACGHVCVCSHVCLVVCVVMHVYTHVRAGVCACVRLGTGKRASKRMSEQARMCASRQACVHSFLHACSACMWCTLMRSCSGKCMRSWDTAVRVGSGMKATMWRSSDVFIVHGNILVVDIQDFSV